MSLIYGRYTELEFHRLKRQALTDKWAFADLINFYGGTEKFEDIHHELATFLDSTNERKLVLMPRGHFKSTFCSTLDVLHDIYKNPNIRIMVGTAVKELATAFVREIKQYLEDPELQELVWNDRPHLSGNLIPDLDRTGSKRKRGGRNAVEDVDDEEFGGDGFTEAVDKKVIWRANALQVNRPNKYKEPTVFAAAVGVIMTGWHYDKVIFDDVVTFKNSDTPEKAEKILDWVKDIESVINPINEETGLGDSITILGTRYYRWDFYGHIQGETIDDEEQRQEFYDTLADDPLHILERDIYGNGRTGLFDPEMPNVEGRTADNGYLCPKLMNTLKERKLRRRLGARRFASQYLNQIIAVEDIKLNWEFVRFFPTQTIEREDDRTLRIRKSSSPDEAPVFIVPWCVVDPAASIKQSADYSAITVGGITEDDNLMVIDSRMGHWTPSQLADKLQAVLEKWRLTLAVVEANGTQVAIVNAIKDRWKEKGFNAAIVHDIPKGDKKQKILDTLEPLMEGRLWMAQHLSMLKEIQEQFNFFPADGARDDFLDTLEKLKRYAKPVKLSTLQRRRAKKIPIPRRNVRNRYGGRNYG